MNYTKPKKMTGEIPPSAANKTVVGGGGTPTVLNWELRPGGMLVQKRNSDLTQTSVSAHPIKIRVKYEIIYHEITINSQASFGELKKMITEFTGLHNQDQKLLFKGKEKDSKEYLDVSGVKDGSKLVLVEDILGREKRVLELRRSATMEKASKAMAEISLEVNKLVDQVTTLDLKISKGEKVAEKVLENLTELLMMQVIKLDGISIDGDLKPQRRTQVKRVQKYIEILDKLKITISESEKIEAGNSTKVQKQGNSAAKTQVLQKNGSKPVVVTTNWETFDSGVELTPISHELKFNSTTVNPNAKFNWELFE